jgi:Activator of Hsp90 ATPase homolog 1-like protein
MSNSITANQKKDFHRTITVNASAKDAIKKISQVNRWWAKNFSGSAEKLDDKFTVRFGETYVDFVISEIVPDKKVVWKVLDCNLHWIKAKKEWTDTEVVFEISSQNNKSKIDFTHVGLVPGVECYNDCEVGWTGHLTKSLVSLMNQGKGMPE